MAEAVLQLVQDAVWGTSKFNHTPYNNTPDAAQNISNITFAQQAVQPDYLVLAGEIL